MLATDVSYCFNGGSVGMNAMGRRLAMSAFVVAGVALLAVAVALLDYLGRDLVTVALAPIAAIPVEPPQPLSHAPSLQGEADLPVPPPLDDERVVDALGPIANVACRAEDGPARASHVPHGSRRVGLDAPLGSIFAACCGLPASHS
ncbi:MAG: hypothetical protein ACM3NZ_05165 [Betaproteobacteria bacterium]